MLLRRNTLTYGCAANLVVPELPQAAAPLRGLLAARGHGGGRGGRGGAGRGRRLQQLVQLVRGLQARRTRAASHQLVQVTIKLLNVFLSILLV